MIRTRFVLAVTLSALVGTAALADKVEFTRPPYAGAYEPQGVDERGLWMEVDEAERGMRDAPGVVRDAELNAYIRAVLCQTVGQDRCGSVRLYIVRDDSFNASMAPNGLMIVHTGLLARIHTEAELAAVLGHEFAHFEKRHSLLLYKKIRSSTDWMAWLGLLGAAAAVNTSNSSNFIIIGVYSFSRAQEAEADLLGAHFVMASTYRLEGSAIWRRSMAEDDAFRQSRGMRKVRRLSPGLGDTHPTDLQRITFFQDLEGELGARGDEGLDSYRDATNRVLPLLFDGLIRRNDFATADFVIRERGEALGWNGELLYYHGELFRLRGNPRDFVTARDIFQRATLFTDAPAEAWRGLGICELRNGNIEAGKAALRTYLERAPKAKDADAIGMLLES